MKKKKKSLFEFEEHPSSKGLKIVTRITILTAVIFVLFLILGAIFPKFAIFLWKNIVIPVNSFSFTFSQNFLYKIGPIHGGIFYLLLFLIVLCSLFIELVSSYTKIKKEIREKIYNRAHMVLYLFLVLEIVLVFCNVFFPQNNPKLDVLFFEEQSKETYTKEDLLSLHQYLEDQMIILSNQVERDSNGEILIEDPVSFILDDLENASQKYWVLKEKYPSKHFHFDSYEFSHDPTTVGLTSFDSVGYSYDQEVTELVNTITHELCHTRGIVRENEATLCSIMVGLESSNLVSQYSAYTEAYYRSLHAIRLIDSKKAAESTRRVNQLCLKNHYKEVCNYQYKLTKYYVKKSDKIEITTFDLKEYSDIDFLVRFLDQVDDYSPKLFIEGEKIQVKDLLKYQNEEKRLMIEIKNSKKIFSEIKDILEENKEYFYSIMQDYPDMYVGVQMEEEEAIAYYTSPIPDSNIFSIFTKSKELEEIFDYSRVVRLILEYFDAENIGYFS